MPRRALPSWWLMPRMRGGVARGGPGSLHPERTCSSAWCSVHRSPPSWQRAVFWPTLEYDAFRYSVREDDLLVQSGVIFKRWSSIPLTRIQHVDTRQGPLERMLGMSRLLVFTAAGMSADGSIPGLATDTAEAMRDELSRRGGDDGV